MRQPQHSGQELNGRWLGLLLVFIGTGWLLRKLEVDFLPPWLFSWSMGLFIIGLFVSIQTRFRRTGPIVVTLVGLAFLAYKYFDLPFSIGYLILPSLVILVGLAILFKPNNKDEWHNRCGIKSDGDEITNKDKLEIVAIFCGSKKRIISKDFKGGEMVAVFGGVELNLTNADFDREIVIDTTVVFGGLKIIIPNNWELKTQMTSIAAGIEDKRRTDGLQVVPDKTLILTGTVVFGGIDIQNY